MLGGPVAVRRTPQAVVEVVQGTLGEIDRVDLTLQANHGLAGHLGGSKHYDIVIHESHPPLAALKGGAGDAFGPFIP